jgi:hypothetical protein
MPAMVPAQVRASPTVMRPSGMTWLRSSWRRGRWRTSASSMVTRSSLARSFARWGPIPGRSASAVCAPGDVSAADATGPAPALPLTGAKSLLRSRDHAIKGPRVRQNQTQIPEGRQHGSTLRCVWERPVCRPQDQPRP